MNVIIDVTVHERRLFFDYLHISRHFSLSKSSANMFTRGIETDQSYKMG